MKYLISVNFVQYLTSFIDKNCILKQTHIYLSADAKGLKLKFVRVENKEKLDTLISLIYKTGAKPTLVFCNHRDAVDRISFMLEKKGLAHDIFHGRMEQDEREKALIKFRNGSHRILVTTDLASRGLDIPEIETVIHYQLPLTEDSFIHRNGRTARMHAKGTSYLILAEEEELPKFITERVEEEKSERGICVFQ